MKISLETTRICVTCFFEENFIETFMAELITLEKFYASSLGKYALRWEQLQFGKLVSDCFGYNALQLGGSSVDFLKHNRIGLKVIGETTLCPLTQLLEGDDRVPVQMAFEEMPFESESIDLVLLPHTLEISEDPHALLREVYRVLIPGGRIILTGFNLTSLWGVRFRMQRFGAKTFLPGRQFMSVFQIRDWLHLLSFHVDRGAFGRYGWTFSTDTGKESWLEKAGDRWWPQCGAIFAISATKEVAGFKLVGRAVNRKFFFLGRKPSPKVNKVGRCSGG